MSRIDAAADSVDQMIVRFAAEHLSRAISRLAPSDRGDAAAIHETRKSIKRIRAALKLMQRALGSRYEDWNDRLRGVNLRLAATRDLDACQQTIDKLAADRRPECRTVLDRLHSELAAQRKRAADGELDAERQSLVAELTTLRVELFQWHPQHTGFRLIRPAVKKMVRQARKRIKILDKELTVESMHALRKVVKRRLYWMEILTPVWSPREQSEQQSIDKLSELLGEHHDLAVLEDRLTHSAVGQDSQSSREVRGVANELRRRREKLEARCLKRAKKLFAETPKELAGRWKANVQAWQAATASRHEAASQSAESPPMPLRSC